MVTAKKIRTKVYYFTRTAQLAAILWNPEKDCILAKFDKWGLFCTIDRKVAQKVLDAGYHQVTSEGIEARNLPLPLLSDQYAAASEPGKGYTLMDPDEVIEPPSEPEQFDTDSFPDGPEPDYGEGGKRKLR